MFKTVGQYSKFIVAVLGAVAVGLTTFAHGAPWAATLISAISAISVYLVPNATPPVVVAKTEPVSLVHPADGTMSPPVTN